MNVLVDYLRVLHAWSSDEHRRIIDEQLARVRSIEWLVPDQTLKRVLVRGLVSDLLPSAMMALLQTPEADRLRGIAGTSYDDPKPTTQALLVSLRRIRGRNARASFLIFAAIRAVDGCYDDRPFVEWVVKAQLFSWPFFPARAQMTPDVYLPSLVNFVVRLCASDGSA